MLRCSHHWLIGPCHGPTSKDTCRKCGEEREFENYLDLEGVPAIGRKRKPNGEFAEMLERPRILDIPERESDGSLNKCIPRTEKEEPMTKLKGAETRRRHKEIVQMLPQIREVWMKHYDKAPMDRVRATEEETGVSEHTLRKLRKEGLLEWQQGKAPGSSASAIGELLSDIEQILSGAEDLGMNALEQRLGKLRGYIQGYRAGRKAVA